MILKNKYYDILNEIEEQLITHFTDESQNVKPIMKISSLCDYIKEFRKMVKDKRISMPNIVQQKDQIIYLAQLFQSLEEEYINQNERGLKIISQLTAYQECKNNLAPQQSEREEIINQNQQQHQHQHQQQHQHQHQHQQQQIQQNKIRVIKKNFNSIQFQLVDQSQHLNKISEQEFLPYAMAFNYQSNIFVYSQKDQIILRNLQNQQLSDEILKFQVHSQVYSIIFSQNKNFFVAGCGDYVYSFLQLKNNNWKFSKLEAFNNQIHQLILNQLEDILYACDYKIIRLFKVDQQQNKITLQDEIKKPHDYAITCISLNPSETIMASLSEGKEIYIWNKTEYYWQFQQKLKISAEQDGYGIRANFYSDTSICVTMSNCKQFNIYNNSQGYFSYQEKILANKNQLIQQDKLWQCPSVFIPEKKLIMTKSGQIIYFLLVVQEELKLLECQILGKGDNQNTFATISQDGQYLVTISDEDRSFKVYKLEYTK